MTSTDQYEDRRLMAELEQMADSAFLAIAKLEEEVQQLKHDLYAEKAASSYLEARLAKETERRLAAQGA